MAAPAKASIRPLNPANGSRKRKERLEMVSQSDNPTRTPQNPASQPNPLKLRAPFAGNMLVKGGDMPKILAIDDDRTVLRLIEKAFEGADVELTTCLLYTSPSPRDRG